MARYRTTRRRTNQTATSGPLIGFLLVASFGILFAGCSSQEPEIQTEEFVMKAEDIAKFREKVQEANVEEGTELGEMGTGAMLEEPTIDGVGDTPLIGELPAVDLSMVETYNMIRRDSSAANEDVYRVTNAFLNVRAEPRVNAAQVESLVQGDTLQVQEFVDAAWAKVLLPNGKEGYVAHRYIAKLTSEARLAEEKAKFDGLYFVDFGFLNVRKDNNSQSEQIGQLAGQKIVRPLSMDEVYARIPFEGGEGYVAVQYLSPFVPNFLVRQEKYTLPMLHYRMVQEGMMDALVKHVDALRQAGYRFITLRDFYDLVLTQEERDVRLDPKTVVIALSDVTPGNIKEVSDALRASDIRATFFLQTQHLGLSGITEKMIMTLLANGHDLQSGGHTGDDMRSLTNAQVDLELAQSRKMIEQYTNKTVFAIGYPRGGVNDRVAQKAIETGYLFGISNAPERTFSRLQFLRLPSFVMSASASVDEALSIARGE